MNAVYIRLAVYVLSTLAGLIPASWAGFVSYDALAMTITISIEGLVTAAGIGLAASGAVFAKWGIKRQPPVD